MELMPCERHLRVQGGCDGSIMIEANAGGEMSAGSNLGVKRLDIINSVKADMEKSCPMTVSCADIIAMAGRDAVAFNGGPNIQIALGRKDADSSSAAQADAELPPSTSNVDRILSVFSPYGMTLAESVAILGNSVGTPKSPLAVKLLAFFFTLTISLNCFSQLGSYFQERFQLHSYVGFKIK